MMVDMAVAGEYFNTPSAITYRGAFFPLYSPTPLTSTWQRVKALRNWALSQYILRTAAVQATQDTW